LKLIRRRKVKKGYKMLDVMLRSWKSSILTPFGQKLEDRNPKLEIRTVVAEPET